jgi:hypothetical protein
MNTRTFLLAGLTAASVAVLIAPEARADSVIKQPSRHPVYRAELEPHVNILPWHRNYGRYGGYKGFGDVEFGGGFRASIELADPAFIPKINNTIAITFGVDFTNNNCGYGRCYHDFSFWSPVALQWNFFLTDKWSVFGEAGFMLRSYGFFNETHGDFTLAAGGRFHFNDKVALTMRIGYPFVSVGVSFFVGS